MDKSTLEKIVVAAVKMARSADPSQNSYSSEESGPVAAALIRAAIDDEEVRSALLS